VLEALEDTDAELVISPQLQDRHHGHEIVAAGVREALVSRAATWWMYGLWHELALPTMYVPFGTSTLAQVNFALAAYVGEIERNGYDRLYPARAIAAAVLGSERIFGFGAASASAEPHAELFTEVVRIGSTWRLGQPRVIRISDPLAEPSEVDFSWWMNERSTRQRHLAEGARRQSKKDDSE
jgi:hypothetical protein